MEERRQQLLSTEECHKILQVCLQQDNLRVISHSADSLSEKIEGFLGTHFVVTIQYEDSEVAKTQRCFMKVLNGSLKTIFEMSISLNAYEKEKFFYEFLLREFEKCGISVSFAPRGYLCKPYLIVLEDLSLRGFRGAPKGSFLNLAHCKAALKTLARFHSAGILFEAKKSDELGTPYSLAENYPKMFQEMIFSTGSNSAKKWFEFSMKGIIDLIELIPENHVTKAEFSYKLREFFDNSEEFIMGLTKFKGTILHGDLWSNNFLFKYQDGVPIDCTLLDYQLLKYGPPSMDVIHTIFANTRKDFRDKHFNELIEFYYQCLSNCLVRLKLSKCVPKDEYLHLCNDLQVAVKLHCICDHAITFMPEEMVKENMVSDEALRRFLFEERGKAIVACFNNGGLFRELIEEDVLELQEMLFKTS